MFVNVKLMSMFAKYLKNNKDGKVGLEEGTTVRGLAENLGLPIKLVRIITVNGKQEDLDKVLTEGDLVYIFPPAIGGG
ncbi:MAG: MoaD/ThiS family protein [Phycisphaerae bacterium]|nr:MoaD/ThiS family protein [Phycisphaerae bacterium]NIU58081.1 MoaD/ThiS family protein [Phycisphaerae bacterium]